MPRTSTSDTRSSSPVWFALPLLLTLGLYGPACLGAEWVTDDWHLIVHHLRPGDIAGEWTTATHAHAANVEGGFLWRPLTSTVYQVWGGAFGRTPPPFRFLSLLFHLANIGLVLAVARRWGAAVLPTAAVATLLAVHPLLVDAVGWVSDLYDLMATTLLLGSAWLAAGRQHLGPRVAGSAGLFLAALLCKESSVAWAAALPAALLVLRGWRGAAAHAAGLGLTAALHAQWHAAVVGAFDRSARDVLLDSPFPTVWLDYLSWPFHLPVRAGYTHLVAPGAEPLPVGGLLFILASGALLVAVRQQPVARPLAAALGTWVVLVSPGALAAAAFLNQPFRYLYLPMVLTAPLLALAAESAPARLRRVGLVAVPVALVLAWTAAVRVQAWQSEPALYEAEHVAEPDNSFAAKELGRIHVARGEVESGMALWAQALRAPPASSFVMDVQQERLDYAQAALAVGRPAEAVWALDAFVDAEAEAGRAVDPSIQQLRARAIAEAG